MLLYIITYFLFSEQGLLNTYQAMAQLNGFECLWARRSRLIAAWHRYAGQAPKPSYWQFSFILFFHVGRLLKVDLLVDLTLNRTSVNHAVRIEYFSFRCQKGGFNLYTKQRLFSKGRWQSNGSSWSCTWIENFEANMRDKNLNLRWVTCSLRGDFLAERNPYLRKFI